MTAHQLLRLKEISIQRGTHIRFLHNKEDPIFPNLSRILSPTYVSPTYRGLRLLYRYFLKYCSQYFVLTTSISANSSPDKRRTCDNCRFQGCKIFSNAPDEAQEESEPDILRILLKAYRELRKCLLCGDQASSDGSEFMDHVRGHLNAPGFSVYQSACDK
jgi:hypothetical protein